MIKPNEEELFSIINVITGGLDACKIKGKRLTDSSDKGKVLSIKKEYTVWRTLIHTDSSVNLITLEVYEKLGLQKKDLAKVGYPLVGLGDKTVLVVGTINLTMDLGDGTIRRNIYVEFMVVDISLSYNVNLGRPILNNNGILINMDCLCMTLLTPGRIAMVMGSQKSTGAL
ncbi:hypothetical protein P3X46_009177 [Hevea brasiliensis]|uniref:Uncharacterized protein n=1 Tax=Hevea brasiliensis TaxID=3981 RepID=A0ABQ9MPV3_HEVBR|nr:hypothetical protein P3X46_009177 [Hevea brasiliensis]